MVCSQSAFFASSSRYTGPLQVLYAFLWAELAISQPIIRYQVPAVYIRSLVRHKKQVYFIFSEFVSWLLFHQDIELDHSIFGYPVVLHAVLARLQITGASFGVIFSIFEASSACARILLSETSSFISGTHHTQVGAFFELAGGSWCTGGSRMRSH